MRWLDELRRRARLLDSLDARMRRMQEALGRIESRQAAQQQRQDIRANEFQVYSQWGEDGIIQWLLRNVIINNRVFVEFGVEDYTESNTRFLLVNDNWSGLVIDASESNIARLRREPLYWRQNLKSTCAFVTRENIDSLIDAQGLGGAIGLLSIDVDGNDYWIWSGITVVDPDLVIVEYNARFGPQRAVTVAYDPNFSRRSAHYSCVYYGASLAALAQLGSRRGYALVGCNSAGNNAFFVKRSRLPPALKERTVAEAFVPARFREARDQDGRLAFLGPEEEQRILETLPLVEVDGT